MQVPSPAGQQVDRGAHQEALDRHFGEALGRRSEDQVAELAAAIVSAKLGAEIADQPLRLRSRSRHRVYIPDRLSEGYGPNTPALLKLRDAGVRVVVTVDCAA